LQHFVDTSSVKREALSESALIEFVATGERRELLSAAVKVSIDELNSAIQGRELASPTDGVCTPEEFLAVCLSREYDNSSVCSVGSVSPLAAISYLLAKRTHAPGLTIIAFNGGFIDVDAHPISMSFAESLDFQTAKAVWGGDDTYHWYYQQGRITHEVIPVAQVDVHGRTNNAWIEGGGKRVRLPGQGGMADVANLHQHFVLYLTRHSPERFAASVKFCTASRGLAGDDQRRRVGLKPGHVRLLSNLGIFELDQAEGRFRLVSIHPGVTVEHIRQQTGGELLVADPLPATPQPTADYLSLIRREIDPFGLRRLEFTSGPTRREILTSILDAEESTIKSISRLVRTRS
jgi:glutaconate CoA-transferase subunit A